MFSIHSVAKPVVLLSSIVLSVSGGTAHAAESTWKRLSLKGLIDGLLQGIGGILIPLAITALFLVFVYGIFLYMRAANTGDGKMADLAKTRLLHGIIVLFAVFSLWGFIQILRNIFGENRVQIQDERRPIDPIISPIANPEEEPPADLYLPPEESPPPLRNPRDTIIKPPTIDRFNPEGPVSPLSRKQPGDGNSIIDVHDPGRRVQDIGGDVCDVSIREDVFSQSYGYRDGIAGTSRGYTRCHTRLECHLRGRGCGACYEYSKHASLLISGVEHTVGKPPGCEPIPVK